MNDTYPILEYDPTPEAIIEPKRLITPLAEIPELGVICFFADVINQFAAGGRLTLLTNLRSEMGLHPVYAFSYAGQSVALFHPGIGAPLAVGLLEEVIALGCRKFVACGGAGVLDQAIAMGHLLIPTTAVRDEGTSYHYLPPAREVAVHPAAVAAIETVLQHHQIDYLLTKTWTTDAFYRETRSKVARRRAEGCLAVEMEAAALFAVAQFRDVPLGHILYGGDNLASEVWDSRDWNKHWTLREKLIGLAAEACLLL